MLRGLKLSGCVLLAAVFLIGASADPAHSTKQPNEKQSASSNLAVTKTILELCNSMHG